MTTEAAEPMATEERQEQRVFARECVQARILSVPGRIMAESECFTCETCDLSLSGLRLLTGEPLETGMLLNLSLHVEGFPSEFLHLGQVRWILRDKVRDAYQIGIQFVFTSTVSRDLWRTYVAEVIGEVPEELAEPEAKSA